jgi:hypothetical protein
MESKAGTDGESSPKHPTAPSMPRTGYKAVFIHEIDELLTIAYIFELLFDHLIPFELMEFCEQIYPMI